MRQRVLYLEMATQRQPRKSQSSNSLVTMGLVTTFVRK